MSHAQCQMYQVKNVGLGLEALIPPKHKKPEGEKIYPKESIFLIEVDKIKPNPFQPRREFNGSSLKELADSIKEFGVLQPLIVSKSEKEVPEGRKVEYYLIAGERRLRAARLVGVPRVPAIIREAPKIEELEMSLIENVQREDLNPLEKAHAFKRLIEEFNLTQKDVALKISQSRESVANALRLLDLPPDIQSELLGGRISEGHARAILSVRDEAKQKSLLKEILEKGASVRKAEYLARSLRGVFKARAEDLKKFTRELKNVFGSGFRLIKNQQGELVLTVRFPSERSFQEFLKKLK